MSKNMGETFSLIFHLEVFCGFVVKEKFLVFGADAFKGVNRKPFVENVFKAKENYITFGKRFVILTGTKV